MFQTELLERKKALAGLLPGYGDQDKPTPKPQQKRNFTLYLDQSAINAPIIGQVGGFRVSFNTAKEALVYLDNHLKQEWKDMKWRKDVEGLPAPLAGKTVDLLELANTVLKLKPDAKEITDAIINFYSTTSDKAPHCKWIWLTIGEDDPIG